MGDDQQIVGSKVLIFWLHYITMYFFTAIKFRNKESVTTQAFAFSKSKSKHLIHHHDCRAT